MSYRPASTHGYDAVFSCEIPDDLTCVICHLVLRDPVQVIDCGHCYCSPCFDQLVEYSNQSSTPLLCPVDKQHVAPNKVFKDKRMMRTIMNLAVKCSANELGCEWSGSLGDLEVHDAQCGHAAKENVYQNSSWVTQNIKELFQRMNRMEDNSFSKEKEIANLKFNLKEMKGNYDKIKNEVKILNESIAFLQNDISVLKNTNKDINNKFSKEIEDLQNKKLNLETEMLKYRKESSTDMKVIQGFIDNSQKVASEQLTLVTCEDKEATICNDLKAQLNKLQEEIRSTRSHLDNSLKEKNKEIMQTEETLNILDEIQAEDINDLKEQMKAVQYILFLFPSVKGPGLIPSAVKSFEEAGLRESILKNMDISRYSKPTPLQNYALPIILGRDLNCAQKGSVKTAAFLLPVIRKLLDCQDEFTNVLSGVQTPLALIIAPTRDLVHQIFKQALIFSEGTNLKPVEVCGGVSAAYQLSKVAAGCHLVVGTPGRLKNFIEQREISLEKIKYLILEETGRMLDLGFMPDVTSIINDNNMPPKEDRNTLMFSATFTEEIQRLAEVLESYVYLTIGKDWSAEVLECLSVDQEILDIDEYAKRDKLVEILGDGNEDVNQKVVFVQTERLADYLASYLHQKGFCTTSLHGNVFQQQRDWHEFCFDPQSVLIATAVAAWGLDMENVGQVINYDLPDEIDEYIHRLGRIGHTGNRAKVISFFSRGKDEGVARALVAILANYNHEVPDWLDDVAETALGTRWIRW